MTALTVISQTNLKINNDTLTCYTKEENRKIALIMIEGERDKELLNTTNQAIDIKDSIISLQNNRIITLDTIISKQSVILNDINDNYKLIVKENDKLIKTNKKTKNTLLVSGGINILLFLILIL
jgi:Cu2+-containing amine oxidase